MNAVFLRLLDAEDKATQLRVAVDPHAQESGRAYTLDPRTFLAVPGAPFAYWAGGEVLAAFQRFPRFESRGWAARQGMSTSDDFRFIRLSHEAPAQASHLGRWRALAKGGPHARFYSDLPLRVSWGSAEAELVAFGEIKGNGPRARQSSEFYLRPGITWSRRTQSGLSLRALPHASTFADKGPSAFVDGDSPAQLLAMLAVTNSTSFLALVQLQMTFGSYQVGTLRRTPIPDLTVQEEAALAALARRAWSLKRLLDTRTETSHAFVLPALLQVQGATLADRATAWAARVRTTEDELAAIQAEIDERCFTIYGLEEENRRAITEGFGGGAGEPDDATDQDADAREDEEKSEEGADADALAAELVSWAAGVAFGRFDAHLATGERELAAEPEPFEPLPVCSPGMLTGADGLPLNAPPAGYPVAFPADGILVDDVGHPCDLVAAVRAVFDAVFGPAADARWQEAAALLDPKGHDLRAWFRSGFFEHHLRRYSKSRRKAPIFWQLGVTSGRYSIWCYAHRLTPDSLFALSRDFVAPKLALEEHRRTALVQEAGPNPTAKQRAELAAQDAVVEELRAFADEVRRVAPLWAPELDDGVVLVSAPLRRLVPHRAWQKELKGRWDDLAKGTYDWAHLAMHLWPERVVPNCANDRSLAIAHGLEEVFWVEGADGKWTRRARPTRPVEELVAERTSPAVKAALADLLAAPAPAGVRGRGRAGE
jgi:hypothetical protein